MRRLLRRRTSSELLFHGGSICEELESPGWHLTGSELPLAANLAGLFIRKSRLFTSSCNIGSQRRALKWRFQQSWIISRVPCAVPASLFCKNVRQLEDITLQILCFPSLQPATPHTLHQKFTVPSRHIGTADIPCFLRRSTLAALQDFQSCLSDKLSGWKANLPFTSFLSPNAIASPRDICHGKIPCSKPTAQYRGPSRTKEMPTCSPRFGPITSSCSTPTLLDWLSFCAVSIDAQRASLHLSDGEITPLTC